MLNLINSFVHLYQESEIVKMRSMHSVSRSLELTELQEFLERLFCVRKLLKTRNAQLYDFHSLVANVWLFDQLQKFLHHFARSVALYEISGIY